MGFYEKQRRQFDNVELPKIQGKVSRRVELLVARSYIFCYLKKPLETITDAEFLTLRGCGSKTLAAIREVIPAPAGE